MKTLLTVLIFVLYSITTDASNYDQEKLDGHNVLENILDDLQDSQSARCQIAKNLALSEIYRSEPIDILKHPLVCVGTGRNIEKLKRSHFRITTVRKNDITIDRQPALRPHFEMNDAFFYKEDEDIGRNFGCVFFAHVGDRLLPINKLDKLKMGLTAYFNLLKHDGLLVYNSEVHKNKEEAISAMTVYYEFDSFDCLKMKLIDIFESIGFVDIDFIIKKESEFWTKEDFSFLIIARKPQ